MQVCLYLAIQVCLLLLSFSHPSPSTSPKRMLTLRQVPSPYIMHVMNFTSSLVFLRASLKTWRSLGTKLHPSILASIIRELWGSWVCQSSCQWVWHPIHGDIILLYPYKHSSGTNSNLPTFEVYRTVDPLSHTSEITGLALSACVSCPILVYVPSFPGHNTCICTPT